MNIIRPLSSLKKTAAYRKPGYVEECLRVGKVSGAAGSELVEFTEAQHADIRNRFARCSETPSNSDISQSSQGAKSEHPEGGATDCEESHPTGGLGDAVHRLAGPIGRAIHWPCMKGDGTTDLKPGSPCDRARNLLNKL
jgi:hypothetical protein